MRFNVFLLWVVSNLLRNEAQHMPVRLWMVFKKLARYASIKKRLNYSRLDETIMKSRAQKPHFGDIFVFEEVSFLSLAPASRKPILRSKERPPHILLPCPKILRHKLRVSSGMLLECTHCVNAYLETCDNPKNGIWSFCLIPPRCIIIFQHLFYK